MAGVIKRMIDQIVDERANGNPIIVNSTRTKIILKGVNPNLYTETSQDDENVIQLLREIATDFNVKLAV